MSKNFINQSDPTKPLEDIPLAKQYAKLSKDEKLLVFMKLKGYSHRPVTISQLYSDEYYLGGSDFFQGGDRVFKFWKEILDKVYINEVLTAKPLLNYGGAIGLGKSVCTRICMAMTIQRLSCMISPSKTFGLAPKPLSFVIFHRNEAVADNEFRRYFTEQVFIKSPFFKNPPHRHNLKIYTAGVRGNPSLGTDTIFGALSEINFFPNEEDAIERINSLVGRVTSRFSIKDHLTLAGHIIIDSSAAGLSAPSEYFKEHTDPKYRLDTSPSHWEVRTELYKESNGETFNFYKGDPAHNPMILPKDYKLAEGMLDINVVKVPIQLLGECKMDMTKFMRDKGGWATGTSDSFFQNDITHVVNCSKIKNRIPEIINVDFYDKTDRLIDKIEPMVQLLTYRTPIWIGCDLGLVNDITGLSIITFEGWEYIGDTKLPKIKCHCMVGISRKEGQQTSLYHIQDLVMSLSKRFNVIFSCDSFQSANLLQDLERDGIHTQPVSTDRSMDPAIYLKTLLNSELITIPVHKRFQREAFDLKYTYTTSGKNQKIDHPKKATQDPTVFDVNNGVGSKDIWDSLVSACYSLKISIDKGEEMGYGQGFSRQMEALKNITRDPREEAQKRIQGMLEDIF